MAVCSTTAGECSGGASGRVPDGAREPVRRRRRRASGAEDRLSGGHDRRVGLLTGRAVARHGLGAELAGTESPEALARLADPVVQRDDHHALAARKDAGEFVG